MSNPYVALKTHEDSGVDGNGHGDLHGGQDIGQNVRVSAYAVSVPEIRETIKQSSANDNDEIGYC